MWMTLICIHVPSLKYQMKKHRTGSVKPRTRVERAARRHEQGALSYIGGQELATLYQCTITASHKARSLTRHVRKEKQCNRRILVTINGLLVVTGGRRGQVRS